MSQTSYAASGQTFAIARVLVAPAIALGLLLSVVFAVQPAAASEIITPQNAVVEGAVAGQSVHFIPAGFQRHGHFKGHRAFKRRGFFKRGHGFKRHSFFKGHRGFRKYGFGKHRFGFRKGFFRGHRGFRSGFFKRHHRFH